MHSIARHRQYRRNIPDSDKVGLSDVITALKSLTEVHHSGQKPKAQEGVPILEELFKTRKELVEDDAWGLTIMPGSGINSKSISSILPSLLPLGLREIHLSGGKWTPGGMVFHRDGMGMGGGDDEEWGVWRTQESEVRKVREMADVAWKEYISNIKPTD